MRVENNNVKNESRTELSYIDSVARRSCQRAAHEVGLDLFGEIREGRVGGVF